jgi:hypothetical protein
MGGVLLAVAAAAGASVLFNVGLVVQAQAARSAADDERPLGLAATLVRRSRWLAGTALAAAGWPLQLLAYGLAPVVVVQPALAAGVVVLLLIGKRLLHEPALPRDVLAVAVVIGSVALITGTVPAEPRIGAVTGALAYALLALAVPVVLALLVDGVRPGAALGWMLAAGCGFSLAALASALTAAALRDGRWAAAAGWGVLTAAAAAAGLLHEMRSVRVRSAVQVATVALGVQTVLPVAVALGALHERVAGTAGAVALAAGVACLLGGATVVARSPAARVAAGRPGAQPGQGHAANDGPSR